MHGPPSSYPTPYGPAIHVLDTCALSLRLLTRKTWRAKRDKALDLWSAAGLRFYLTEGKASDYPAYSVDDPAYPHWVDDPDNPPGYMAGNEDAFMRGLVVPGYARLMFMPENWAGGSIPGMGWMFENGGFAIINRKAWVANKGNSTSAYYIRHEFGHCLGLSHQRQMLGGNPASVMYVSTSGYKGGDVPDDHDLASLHQYHFGLS